MSGAHDSPGPRPLLVALLLVGAFMSTFIAGAIAVAMPAIASSLRLDFSTAIFVQAAYILTATIFLIPAGRLADAHGRLDYYLAGLAVFAVSSLLAGLAPTAGLLIAARCVQGIGAALVAATSEAILVSLYPDRQRGHAIGINVTVVYLGVSLGPVVGGILTGHLGWRWIFFVSVPIAAGAFAGLVRLRWTRGRHRKPEIDVSGSLLFAAAATSAIVGLSYAPVWGWGSVAVVSLLCGAAVAAAAFFAVEARVANPVLDRSLLFGNKRFLNVAACTLLNAVAVFAIGLLVSLFLQLVQHRTVAATGLLLLSQPVLMACCSPFFGRAYDRIGPRALTAGGMIVIAAALGLLASLSARAPVASVVACLGLLGVGMSAFSSPNEADGLGAASRAQFGTAASILGTARFMGQFLSLAVLGAVAAAHLGRSGARVIFLHSGGHEAVAAGYAAGFRIALVVAAAVALLTAAIALRRPQLREERRAGEGRW